MSMSDEARGTPKHMQHGDKSHTKPKKSFKERYLPQRGDSSSVIANKIIVIIAAAVFVVCMVILANYFYRLYEAKKNNSDLKSIYQSAQQKTLIQILPTDSETDSDSSSGEVQYITVGGEAETDEDEEVYSTELLIAAQELLAINSDTVGYIEIPDCLYEPVVQTEDNDYYLTHNFYGQVRSVGTCFVDYRNVVYGKDRSDNIVLYGHNNKDGSMFGNMDYYSWNASYWKQNPFIYFNTNYSEDIYVITSSFITNSEASSDNGNLFDYYNFINFNDGDYSYDNWIKEITERSMIITGVDVQEGDQFLTLSTCSYEWDDARHVIVARKLRKGESTDDIDLTQFQVNSNPKWPAIYYKYNGGSYIEQE